MPGPRSATLVVTESPVSSAVMMIGCSFGEYRLALSMSFTKMSWARSGSASTGGRSRATFTRISRAFDSDGHQAADGVERPPRESCSRNTKAPDGPHAETYWDEVNTLRRFDGHFIAEECGFHFLFIKMGGAIS